MKYDVIGTMEEFDSDIKFIARRLALTELLDHKNTRANQTSDSKMFQNNKADRMLSHFSLLEKDVKLRLYNLYRIDFEMFGYEATKYL